MEDALKPNSANQTNGKWAYIILMVTLPIIVLLSVEGVLRVFKYGDNLDLFIQNPAQGFENYYIVNPKIGKKYFQKFEYTAPANDIFLKDKPKNTFRIFVMGSSTVYGFPYERNLMFSRILHERLKQTYPSKQIEVVNTAITAINSYTLVDFIDEILDKQPDAILVYAGHNEFYGAFGVGSNETMSKSSTLTQLHLNLMSLRLYQLLKNTITNVASSIGENNKEEVHGTLMKRIVANKDILLDSDDYKLAMKKYYSNMSKLLNKAKANNVPVFISELVSNTKDIAPFNSIEIENIASAQKVYEKAQATELKGDFSQAKTLYTKAKDLDCVRFRASEDVNSIIKELAMQTESYFIPLSDIFEKASANGIIGNNLMTEHVHPNINGNFLMAEVFFKNLVKSKLIDSNETPYIISLPFF